MALIHIYNGIKTRTTYTFSGKISEHVKDIDWDNSIILKAGQKITPDYEVQPDDIIYIRKTPTASAVIGVGLCIGAVALVAGAVSVGVTIYNNKKQLAELESATAAAKAGAESTNKLPYIKGARNQAATGQTFPYLIGRSLMTPYRLCPEHYTISGERGANQFFNVVLEIAFNNILIEAVKLGDTTIKEFSETAPQSGVYSWDSGVYYDEDNLIEIRQTGAFTTDDFNKKIICTEINSEIPHRHATSDATENQEIEDEWQTGVVQQLPTYAQKVELIALFDGLQKYGDNGWESQTITLQPQWTNVDNPEESDWVDFSQGFNQDGSYSNTFTYTTSKQMRFIATQEFTAAQAYGKNIKVRIRRTTPKADGSAKDSVYLMAVQTTIYDAKKSTSSQLVTAQVLEDTERDKCCRIGLRIAANANTTGLIDAISVIAQGTARTWNGTEWSATKTPTSNLAAWVLEILTSPHHTPSRYDDTELDLDTFGEWYEYCEAQGFNADGVIIRNAKKKTIIDTLCQNSNAALFYNPMTGLIEAALDNGRDYSVALLNSENIISITTTKDFKRKADGIKVKYINAAADYDGDSVTFMRDGGEYDPASDTLTEAGLEYVTGYAHAFKIAWRRMAEELAQPRIVTVKVGREAAYYPLYSRVDLQHKSLKIGLAHGTIKALVWNNSYLQQIVLNGSVTFPEGTACGVIINCVSDDGRGILSLKVSGSGTTDTLEVDTTLRSNAEVIPTPGDILSFGELDADGEFTVITSQMKITNAEENDDGYTLTLVDYNPAVYEYGELPTYKSNLTSIPNGTLKTIESQREYITAGEAQAGLSEAVQAAVDTTTKGYRFTNVYKVRPVEACLDEIIAKIDDDARNSSASISMSEDEILLQVSDMERELVGLIDIQAGAVTALVEGGGASGQMSLSLNLPVMIDAAKRAELVEASSEAEVAAVYALVEGTTYYGIKGDATGTAVKTLWDAAVAAGLIASQIELQADQIYLNGEVIVNNDSKIKAALIDVENLLATDIAVKDKGVIHSDDFNGTIDDDGNITESGSSGWAIDHAGHAMFSSLFANGNCAFNGGLGEPTRVNSTEWELSPNGVYLIFCYKGATKTYLQIPSYKGYVCASDVSIYLFSGNTKTEFISGIPHTYGNGYLYKIREQSSVCTAAKIHDESTDAFRVTNYDYLKVTFASSGDPQSGLYNVVTVLKIGNI